MLLNEVATVTNIKAAAEKRDAKKKAEKLSDTHVNKPKQREFKDPDELSGKRSTADQFRVIARGLRKNKD